MLDPLRIVGVVNHTDQTRTKGLYIPRKISWYPVYTSTVFNGVYTKQGKVDYRAQQSQVQNVARLNTKSTTQRQVVFHLVASCKALELAEEYGLEVSATTMEALAENS